MALYLVESVFNGSIQGKEAFESKVSSFQKVLAPKEATLIEVQVSKDLTRAFFIVESGDRNVVTESLREQGIPVTLIKPVRLVGQELSDVKKQASVVNYLVEWNLPEN